MGLSTAEVQSIFGRALEFADAAERANYIASECGNDRALRAEVESLLSAYKKAGGFLETAGSPHEEADRSTTFESIGTTIGPYKLLERIGEGGFGIVFMAEQLWPIRRRVALKIVKPGMDTRQVIGRFEAERQALAMMDHPNIAKVLDAGTVGVHASACDEQRLPQPDTLKRELHLGRPYFVMELVRGQPITDYCDENQLSVRERLALFISVCQAVQHAHQKGIIHRDIKPSNVLVTLHDGTPVPKVIDFGVAKALRGQLTDKTLFTGFAQMIGTPLYMSPEQTELSGLDVDTRSDIYSLGVLLYELLTGTTPFEKERLLEAGYDEMRRIIRDEEPARPSMRLSTLGELASTTATRRHSDLSALIQQCRGELDWIAMKAMEKDRRRRYETANLLAADVQRYLSDEPVSACPPSVSYRLCKFARRNKSALVAAILVATALLGGIAVSTWQAIRATDAEQTAEQLLEAEKNERGRAVRAERQTQRQLFESLLAGAGASRLSRQAGQRIESWRSLAEAARLLRQLDLGDDQLARLRDEAIACLALPDVRAVKGPWKSAPASSPVEFDLDLRHYARVDSEGAVCVHAMDNDRELARLPGPAPKHVKFSSSGNCLAVQYASHVAVWDWRHDSIVFQTKAPAYNIAVGFCPDDKLLAVGYYDGGGSVVIYELPGGAEKRRISLGVLPMHLAFHPSGDTIAVNGGQEVQIRDVATGREIRKLPHPVLTFHVAWNEDGLLLATTGDDHQIYVWDTATGVLQMKGPHARPRRSTFANGADLLLTWGGDDISRLWNPWTGQTLFQLPGAASQLSRDGRWLVTQRGGHLTLWELVPALEYRTLPRRRVAERQSLWQGDISPDGRWLVQGTDQGLLVWDLPRRKQLALLPVSRVTHARFHPSGKEFFTSGPTGLYRWPVELGPEALRLGPPRELPVNGYTFLERIGLDRDATKLAVADLYAGCHILDLSETAPRERLVRHPRAVWAVMTPDGQWVVTSTQNGSGIKVWEAESGREVRDLAPGSGPAAITLSHDGQLLATATNIEYAVWKVGTWDQVLRIPREQSFEVGSAAFSPIGNLLAVTLAPSTVDLIDPQTGRQLARLRALENGWLSLVGFSPDGSQLAASGIWDSCVWDLRRIGERLHEIQLDWDLPSFGPASQMPDPVRVEDASGYDFALNPNAYLQRAESLARQGKWRLAAADMARGAYLSGSDEKQWSALALLRLAADDRAGYQATCRAMLSRFGPHLPNIAERTAKACLLAPDAVPDYEPVMRLAQFAVTGTESHQDYKWFALALGMAHYRMGENSDAIKWLNRSLSPGAENPYRDGLAQAFLAMAHHRLGQSDAARQALAIAREMQQKLPPLVAGDQSWPDVLRLHIVRREAEALLNESSDVDRIP
jgi:serine/threonine protein kinase/WD40 repeat protein